jgi:hypothetical protein
MKKLLLFIPAITLLLVLNSCSNFFGYNPHDDYRRGVAAGRAEVIRQRYWEEQNKLVEPPVTLEKRYTPIFVPEHTTQDGLIIEAHQEIVETVH